MQTSSRFHILAGAGALLLTLGWQSAAQADVSETRDVKSFTRVMLDGSSDVDIEVGGKQSVTVSARDKDILDHVTTEVRDGTLRISHKGHGMIRFNNTRIKVTITVPKLEGMELDGSGDMTARGVDAKSFEIDLDGSGDIDVAGSCGDLDLTLDGSGDVDARDLKCKSILVKLDGSGDVDAYASEAADVRLQGSGDITVYGNPQKRRQREQGSGDVDFVS